LEFSSPSRRIFIGSHSLPPSLVRRIGPSIVQEAQDRLEERRHQEKLTQDREKLDNSMPNLDNSIKFLYYSRPDIVSNIDRLKKRRAELMKELSQVNQHLTVEE
jgi:archaellum component FlaC